MTDRRHYILCHDTASHRDGQIFLQFLNGIRQKVIANLCGISESRVRDVIYKIRKFNATWVGE